MKKIIGFVGYKNSGKTTACNIIRKYSNEVVHQHNFKDGLIRELKRNFPNLLSQLSGLYEMELERLFIEKPPAVRALMQEYGTEVRRGDRDDYWIEKWVDSLPTDGMILVDDVRFENEARKLLDCGGILIRLVRKDMVNIDSHQSETEQDKIKVDYTITTRWGQQDVLESELFKIVNGQI